MIAVSLLPSLPAGAVSRSELESRVATLKKTLDAIAVSLSAAEMELDAAQKAVDVHTRALATAGKKLATLRTAHSRRSAEMYIAGSMGLIDTIVASQDVDVFVERLGYLERIRSAEEGTLESIVALQRRAKTESVELRQARDAAAAALRTLQKRRSGLDAKLREWQSLLDLSKAMSSNTRASRSSIRGFRCPVSGPHGLSNDFGDRRRGGPHQGIDMPANSGTPLVAVLTGRVSDVVRGGWMGRGVILRDTAGNEWWYAHLSSTYVSRGESVTAGQILGRVGCTGNCTGPHLHFEYHPAGGAARNPYKILRAAC
ncbi:MAG TPA: M23 family metallopeptidase [Actinomycetota bacterium]|nr:M23 family metallopeptidase [Actinomycetota bacterium]